MADAPHGATVLQDVHVEAVVASAESALDVSRRYQFFVWTQGSLQVLLPHQLAICGAYLRHRHELVYDTFNSVPVDSALFGRFADDGGVAMNRLQNHWLAGHCKPVVLDVDQLPGEGMEGLRQGLRAAGLQELLLHGVSRPQRRSEIESFFVFAWQQRYGPRHKLCCELLMPHLHTTWQRVQGFERELKALPPPGNHRSPATSQITERERQILRWLREGFSNPRIGEGLGISALTVKNHVQKILRKLNASNRAQAVAIAISLNLLSSSKRDD